MRQRFIYLLSKYPNMFTWLMTALLLTWFAPAASCAFQTRKISGQPWRHRIYPFLKTPDSRIGMFHPDRFMKEQITGNASVAWGSAWGTVNQSVVYSQTGALMWILVEFLSRSNNIYVLQSWISCSEVSCHGYKNVIQKIPSLFMFYSSSYHCLHPV